MKGFRMFQHPAGDLSLLESCLPTVIQGNMFEIILRPAVISLTPGILEGNPLH